ncbi:MAG: helix-turn-helix transcriptional regulator [Oscillospiraceae bacterium]|nr:helix-turn-helix transcriptional regulator [Oscillospiraceae bacterium]
MTHEYQETRKFLHARIRTLRKKSRITQEKMAHRLGISRRTYANYERGVHAMPVEVLVCIADMFGTSLDYLTGREMPTEQEMSESEEVYDRTCKNRYYYRENLQSRQS